MPQRPRVDLRSLTALAAEWLVCAATLAAALNLAAWWAYAAAFVVIATRQHGLLMLFHDAVHGLLARDRRVNDSLINFFVGVPLLLPVEVYRPLHIAHHRQLGTAADPERTLLYVGQPWHYRPLRLGPLLRQLCGDLFAVSGARTMAAWRAAGGAVRLRPGTWALAALWIGAIAPLAWRWPQAAVTVALLWFLPLLTLTQLLQKLRSFAEHSGGPNVTPGWGDWTYTWRVGIPGRLTVWPYNINLHLEHHANPYVPWHGLPELARATPNFLVGDKLWTLLYKR